MAQAAATDGVNWGLLAELWDTPHRLLNIGKTNGLVGEILREARSSHHLLDVAGIRSEDSRQPDSSDLDARTYLAAMRILEQQGRLDRISERHSRSAEPGGKSEDYCAGCGELWPCADRRIANGPGDE